MHIESAQAKGAIVDLFQTRADQALPATLTPSAVEIRKRFIAYLRITLAVSALILSLSSNTAASDPADKPLDTIPLQSPLIITGPADIRGVSPLQWQQDAYEALKGKDRLVLAQTPLGQALAVDLDLRRVEVFATDARVVAGSAKGDVPLGLPDVVILTGHVVGYADSRAYLAFSPAASNGIIEFDDHIYIVSSGPPTGWNADAAVYELNAQTERAMTWYEFVCHTGELGQPAILIQGDQAAAGDPPCRVAEIAIETDTEFLNLFGGDQEFASAYVATLIGATSSIYARDFNVRMQITYLRLWEGEDPWTQTNTANQLAQFRGYWNNNMAEVERHDTHFLSGRPLGGGIAHLPGLCILGQNYALSANLIGFFPLPLEHNHPLNWDVYVVSHEFGHNFGAPHTHEMNPPVDECGLGNCQDASNGTIMSYCHTCGGGMANIRLEFADRTIDEQVLPYLDSTECDLTGHPDCAVDNVALPDDFEVIRGNHTGGALADLFDSDDQRVRIAAGLTAQPFEPPAWIRIEAMTTIESPAAVSLTFESNVNTPGVTQTIELFDFVIGSYETVDVRVAMIADSTLVIDPPGDAGRFVQAGTGLLRAQVFWHPPALTLLFPWTASIDQVTWTIQP